MNVLTDALPSAVTIRGKAYPVYTDYRHWIRFFDMLGSDATDRQKTICALQWYKGDVPQDVSDALHGLLQFASCADCPGTEQMQEEHSRSAQRLFDWSFDSKHILGAFLQTYRIDLTTEKMHWYKFNALLEALPDDTPLKKRIAYRSIHVAEISDDKRRAEIIRIQNRIRIPSPPMAAGACGSVFGAALRR